MNTQPQSDIADRVKRAGLSLYALAKRTGLRWETVRDVVEGKRTPRRETRQRIETALDAAETHG